MTNFADHLCVLVHGLWGNPSHLGYMASELQKKHDDSKLRVHVAVQNSGNFTYDGIERGGERVLQEIEELLKSYSKEGITIRKFSLVGYSLGGLVARYVAGLMYSKGLFNKMEPVNFTTFATPHLGVRTPLLGYHHRIWNIIGARTLSASGKQLFTVDDFRGTGRSLLDIMADKDLMFWKALSVFKNKNIYANVINDRSVNYYTAAFSRYDPYEKLDDLVLSYLPGYENVMVDPSKPVLPVDTTESVSVVSGSSKQLKKKSAKDVAAGLPYYALYAVLIPIGISVFMVNALIQTFSSSRRIRLHDSRRKHPSMVEDLQETMENVIEDLHHSQDPQHLPEDPESSTGSPVNGQSATTLVDKESKSDNETKSRGRRFSEHFPTLALTPEQFTMISNLDLLGFKKFPVHIHKLRHSHAAIIVRSPKNEKHSEGTIVIRHWLDELFEL